MIFEVVDLDSKLQSWVDLSQNCNLSDFYEIWHSQQIEHANYEYDIRQCLEHSRDYWLRMIIGLTYSRTFLIALTPC